MQSLNELLPGLQQVSLMTCLASELSVLPQQELLAQT